MLIFLCMALRELMENPNIELQSVILQCHSQVFHIVMKMQTQERHLRLTLAEDFLQDMEATLRFVPGGKGTSSSQLEIVVPLV
ncbi:hypothetical protein [Oligoflexus sp.]|uniref:hypothetical protein n=1 Tax=Oligoflexus sp. TaxID=1971216 RepID=UPI002D77B8CF|nr:hypothetical protein [Oligoflexus sp.]